MASLLESFIRNTVAKSFKNQLLHGVFLRPVLSGVNEYGDAEYTFTQYAFQGIRDTFDKRFAATHGIPTTDVRILMIAGLIVPTTTPQLGDKIRIRGDDGLQKWHEMRRQPTVDPANAHFVLQCFEVPEPEDAP